MDKFSILEKYFEGTLSSLEKEEFESLLNSDKELKKEFDFQLALKKATRKERKIELKKEFQELEKELSNTGTSKSLAPLLKIVASVVLIFSIGTYFFLNNGTASPKQLYSENFSPYRNVINPIVRGENSDNIEFKAFLNYENKRFAEAIPLFDSAYSETKKSHLLFYKANCLLAINKPNKALNVLKKYIENDDAFIDKAYWYIALTHLKLNNTEEAKAYLEKVISFNTYKKEEALAVLKKL